MVSQRLLDVPASPIRKLVPYAVAAKKQGVQVYHLNIGDPDIKTPEVMLRYLKSWKRNPVGYSQSQGEPALLESLGWYYNKLGATFIHEENIQVTLGGSEAISWALFAVCNPGDEVLVFEPFYANYNTYAIVNGVRLIPIQTTLTNSFHLPERRAIEEKITNKTKAVLICNPNNPTGTVYTKDEMDMLVSITRDRNLFLLSDEVYREFTYDNRKHVSLLSYMKANHKFTIVLDSLSKRYSVCGARIGTLVSLNPEVMAGVLRIGQGRLSAGLIDQLMSAQLTKVPKSYFTSIHAEYEKRRNILYSGLRAISGIVITKPEGAFYAIAELPVDDAESFCQWLLTDFRDHNETVMLAPAAGFYATKGSGKREVRLAYVINARDIKRSVELVRKALEVYPKRTEKI